VAAEAKVLSYAVALDCAGRASAEGGVPAEVPDGWQAEHLLLAGLVRCTLTSLRYHAQRAGIDDLVASGSAAGRITKREADERYAFVAIECELEVEFEPAPPDADLRELLAKAERDCFVGASLTAPPSYRWRVNGRTVMPIA
jgi:uncharacterized OsmC-like protein